MGSSRRWAGPVVSAIRSHAGWQAEILEPRQDIREAHDQVVRDQQRALQIGGRLPGLLAVASVAVLAGGCMAVQTRRVGLLIAVGGGTPRLVAVALPNEYLVLALLAGAAGLAAGWLTAPCSPTPVPAPRQRRCAVGHRGDGRSGDGGGTRGRRPRCLRSCRPRRPHQLAPSTPSPTRPAHPGGRPG